MPSEHTIKGLRYDAEVQMFHVHPVGGRLSSIGVVIEASDEVDAFNFEFQEILDEFEKVYEANELLCSFRRELQSLEDAANFDFPEGLADALSTVNLDFGDYEIPSDLASTLEEARASQQQSDPPTKAPTDQPTNRPTDRPTSRPTNQATSKPTTTQQRKFDPYSNALMPTIFFYRYNGSITEPPCKDITWWVMTEPMKIARGQLLQLQRLLFTNVDPNKGCAFSSVHNANQSVARPIFPLGSDREIQGCVAGSFESDFEKFNGIAKKCRL